jgi:hypothetical protein
MSASAIVKTNDERRANAPVIESNLASKEAIDRNDFARSEIGPSFVMTVDPKWKPRTQRTVTAASYNMRTADATLNTLPRKPRNSRSRANAVRVYNVSLNVLKQHAKPNSMFEELLFSNQEGKYIAPKEPKPLVQKTVQTPPTVFEEIVSKALKTVTFADENP